MERAHHIEKVADEGMPIVGYQAIAQVLSEQLADARATIAALQARVQELEQPVYVCQGCGRLGRDGWLPTSFTSDELRGSVQCPDCGCIDREKNTARELATICTKAQCELTQRTAELEALRKWRDYVTVALQRPGGAFFEDVPKHIIDLVAELERVRGERDEQGKLKADLCKRLSDVENAFVLCKFKTNELRKLVAALPKVEGEVVAQGGYVKDRNKVYACFGSDADMTAYAALLKHRQGMEG